MTTYQIMTPEIRDEFVSRLGELCEESTALYDVSDVLSLASRMHHIANEIETYFIPNPVEHTKMLIVASKLHYAANEISTKYVAP